MNLIVFKFMKSVDPHKLENNPENKMLNNRLLTVCPPQARLETPLSLKKEVR